MDDHFTGTILKSHLRVLESISQETARLVVFQVNPMIIGRLLNDLLSGKKKEESYRVLILLLRSFVFSTSFPAIAAARVNPSIAIGEN